MISGSAYNLSAEIGRQQALSRDIAGLQTDISTGVKIHAASDDPAAAARVARIQTTQSDNAVFTTNAITARSIASLVDTSLQGLSTSLTRANELMLQATTGTVNSSDRAAIATELQGILDDVNTASTATDSSGAPLYAATGTSAIAIPIGRSTAVVAAESFDDVFGGVTQADGTTVSIQTVLQNAIAAVNSGDQDGMSTALGSVQAAGDHVIAATTDAGVRAARINTQIDRLATDGTDLSSERTGLEDTDLTAAAAQLSQKMTTLSAAQSVLAQLSKSTLFDKLG